MRELAVEVKIAEKRLNKIIAELGAKGIEITLVDVDVLEGSSMFTQAIITFDKNANADAIKESWDRDIQTVPDGCIEIITRIENMKTKIEEEYEVWKESNSDKRFIFFAQNGRTFLTKAGDMRTMKRLLKGDVQVLADSKTRVMHPYKMVVATDKTKLKKNDLASEIMGMNVKGPALICKEEIDKFGDIEYTGLTKKEIDAWRFRASKIRNSMAKKAKK